MVTTNPAQEPAVNSAEAAAPAGAVKAKKPAAAKKTAPAKAPVAKAVAAKAPAAKAPAAKSAEAKKAEVKKTEVKKAAPAKKAEVKAKPAKAKAAAPATEKQAAPAKEKAKKTKLVRDSFSMPEGEYAVLGAVKKACLKAGIEVKKSELLRIGVALIQKMDVSALKGVLATLQPLKAGRPKQEK